MFTPAAPLRAPFLRGTDRKRSCRAWKDDKAGVKHRWAERQLQPRESATCVTPEKAESVSYQTAPQPPGLRAVGGPQSSAEKNDCRAAEEECEAKTATAEGLPVCSVSLCLMATQTKEHIYREPDTGSSVCANSGVAIRRMTQPPRYRRQSHVLLASRVSRWGQGVRRTV